MLEDLFNFVLEGLNNAWCVILIIILIILYVSLRSREVLYYIEDSNIDKDFKRKTRNILETSTWKRWRSYRETNDPAIADIYVELAHRDSLDRFHTEPEYYDEEKTKQIRFSITTHGKGQTPHVYIDHLNWLEGIPASGLTLEEYQTYVINHEFGHGLGYDHQPCGAGTGRCPVMYQSTRGCPAGRKCGYMPVEADITALLV